MDVAAREALYEVIVWNVDTTTAEHAILTVGHALAETVDAAYERMAELPDYNDEGMATLYVVVVSRA